MRSAQIEAGVPAGDDVERPAGRKLDDGRNGNTAEQMIRETVSAVRSGGLKHGAGDPAVTLVINRVGALEEREAAVLRLKRRLQVAGVVDGMRPGVTGEKFELVRKALG